MTNQEIITRGELIRDETVTGANTAQRVGEAFVAIGENLGRMPIIVDDEKNDFSVKDKDGNAIFVCSGGDFQTKNFDSRNAATKDELSELENFIPDVNTLPMVIDEPDADFSVKDENGNAILVCSGGDFWTKNFDSRDITKRYIFCIGDSVTQGQSGIDNPRDNNNSSSSANCYPNRLQDMVSDKYTVVNLGAGGQKAGEILARNGLLDAIVKTQFILKGDGTTSILCNGSNSATTSMGVIVDSCAGEPINYMLQQGTDEARNQMSRCYINNIQCTLSYNSADHNLYIKRNDVVSYNLTIPVGTHITFGGNIVSNDRAIYCMMMGLNDISSNMDIDNYIDKIKQSIVRLNTNKYIIAGLTRGYNSNFESTKRSKLNEINERLSKEFGARYIDAIGYICSLQAFYELGITPTEDGDISESRISAGVVSDVYSIENRMTPSSFWRYSNTPNHDSVDSLHMNYDGYSLLAKLFYSKIKELNWI